MTIKYEFNLISKTFVNLFYIKYLCLQMLTTIKDLL